MNYNLSFYALCAAMIALLVMLVYILRGKRRGSLNSIMILLICELLIWQLAVIVQKLGFSDMQTVMFWDNITYLGSATCPVTVLLLAIVFCGQGDGLKSWQKSLMILPVVTQVMLWTNDMHHLFYQSFDPTTGALTPGIYFYFHAFYSYCCLVLSFIYLANFIFRRSTGRFSTQSALILMGALFPAVANLCYTLAIPGFDVSTTPIAFTITVFCYMIAMLRYKMLTITPVAMQTVMDRISDGFVVVDIELNVLEYNRTFADTFRPLFEFKKGVNAEESLTPALARALSLDYIRQIIANISKTHEIVSHDTEMTIDGQKRYFTVEFTPIVSRNQCRSMIILCKDVTQHMVDKEQIKANQDILLERERLASLGQLIGGIAHNLKTPIMSVSGGLEQLAYLSNEYKDSLGDPEVTDDDYREIAGEMLDWIGKLKVHMSYMSDIISAVKDQAVQFNVADASKFTVDELLKRMALLMQHELAKNNCMLNSDIQVDPALQLSGDIKSLIQILDNIVVNAIQSYQGQSGDIDFAVYEQNENLVFRITDKGMGIDDITKARLFKEMVTTKGKHGTGLGLYMCYSTIKGMFRGNLWFESEAGQGTTFYVEIPIERQLETEEVG